MYFYCTTKVNNYYKVGISSSYSGIKNRLSDYRQISPNTNISFFTEIPSSSIENSFKNKFDHFRVGNSECYTLKKDIIFKHVLKYIHSDTQLFGFWDRDRYFISEHYFYKDFIFNLKNISYTFNKRDHDPFRHENFVCVGKIDQCRNKNNEIIKSKTGKIKYKIYNVLLDTKKRMNEYYQQYNNFIHLIYYNKTKGTRAAQIERLKNFEKEIFKNKIIFDDNPYLNLERDLFNQIKKSDSKLVKCYNSFIKNGETKFNWGFYAIRSKNYRREERIFKKFQEDYSNLTHKLEREIENKTFLNKDDFLDYYIRQLAYFLEFSLHGTDKTKAKYLRILKSITRKSFNNIKSEIEKISFIEESPEVAQDEIIKKIANDIDFEKSLKVLIKPWDKGFTMGILESSMPGFTEEEKDLCLNIAKGMIKVATDNPHLIYNSGKKELKNKEKKQKEESIIKNLKENENILSFNPSSTKKTNA